MRRRLRVGDSNFLLLVGFIIMPWPNPTTAVLLALIAPAIPITVGPIAIAIRSIGPIARIARTTIRCPMAAATGASIRAADTANLFDDERRAIRDRQVSHARDHRRV